jgi:hypothetical protein
MYPGQARRLQRASCRPSRRQSREDADVLTQPDAHSWFHLKMRHWTQHGSMRFSRLTQGILGYSSRPASFTKLANLLHLLILFKPSFTIWHPRDGVGFCKYLIFPFR